MGPYFRRIKGLSQTVFTRKIADPMRPLAPTPYCQQVMNCKMTIEMEEDRFSTINVLNELNVFVDSHINLLFFLKKQLKLTKRFVY
jgi:hypothetical protein